MIGGSEESVHELALRESVDAVRAALAAAARQETHGPGDLPSPHEIRELLRLFAQLPTEDLRQAVTALLRDIVEASWAP